MKNHQTLYRPSSIQKIQEVNLTYIEPGSSQMGMIVEMIRLGLKDTILSPQEQSNLTKDEMFQKCLENLSATVNEASPTIGQVKQANSLSQILAGVETSRLFHQVISECFPEIETPHLLSDESKLDIFIIVFSQMVENISNAATSIKAMQV